jgi:hypothetical protein
MRGKKNAPQAPEPICDCKVAGKTGTFEYQDSPDLCSKSLSKGTKPSREVD